MKEEISNILKKHVDIFGFISIDEYLKTRSTYGKEDSFSRIPNFSKYKTIIVLGLSYPSKTVEYKGKSYGVLSRYSYNTDYHLVFKKVFETIEKAFDKLKIKSHFSVDVSDIYEKQAATLANLGYIGKNQLLINNKYGTYLNLATILVDIDITKNIEVADDCGDCTLCIDACPSSALDNGFDRELCISDISQEKNILSETEISYFKEVIYGCDICQQVCPKNTGIDFHLHEEYEPAGFENINLISLLDLTNKEFKEIYGQNASSWTGSLVLKRNAVCMIGNQKLVSAIPEIKRSIDKYKNVSWYNETATKILKMLESE